LLPITVPYFCPGAWRIWLALVPIGILSGIWIDKRAPRFRGWNYRVNCLAIFLYIDAVYTILPPKSDAQAVAFFPLLVALLYVLVRVWMRAARIGLLGFVLGVFDRRRFFCLPRYFSVVDGWGRRWRFDLRRLLAEEGVNRWISPTRSSISQRG
jgi:hypothetical protein